MYRFETKDGQWTRIDPNDVRHLIPVGTATGLTKVIVSGGHAVTVKGDVEAIHSILNQYRLASAVSDAQQAVGEVRAAMENTRAVSAEIDATTARHGLIQLRDAPKDFGQSDE